MAHCETARYIASVLSVDQDRIGVVCITKDDQASATVLPLGRVNVKTFKSAIDSIHLCCEGLTTATLSSSLELAQHMLMSQVDQNTSLQNSGIKPLSYGHICVLTQRTGQTWNDSALDSRLTLHIICGDIMPNKQKDLPWTNGWRIHSQYGDYPKPLSKTAPKSEKNDVAAKIDLLLAQARTGHRLGTLNNVEWELSGSKDTTIEMVWGADRIKRMQPGEVSTLIVKIRCNLPKTVRAFHDVTIKGDDDDDMFGEVERLFSGLTGTPLLRAAVSYSNSSLPDDTVCASMGTCYARRFISSPGTSTMASRSKTALFSPQRVAVHKCLTLHCFATCGPEKAVKMLEKALGEGSRQVACGQFIAALVNQRRYQSIKRARHSLSREVSRSILSCRDSTTSSSPPTPSLGKRVRQSSNSSCDRILKPN